MNHTLTLPIVSLKQYEILDSQKPNPNTLNIIYVLSGQIELLLPSGVTRKYNSNNIFILSSKKSYTLSSNNQNSVLHLALTADFIEQYIGSVNNIICDSVLEPNKNYMVLKKIISSITSQYFDTTTSHELSIYGLLFQLLNCLKKEYYFSFPYTAEKISSKYHKRIVSIQEYFSENYNKNISLSSLAEHLFLTPQYLSKFFKSYFRTSFTTYLNTIRLQHAVRDICYSDASITDIALRHGFTSIATFNKYFRAEYKMSPRVYRKKYKNETYVDFDWNPESTEQLDRIVINDSIHNRNVIINTSSTTVLPQNYTSLVNIGFAKNLLSGVFRNHLLNAIDDLNIKYIRLEGLVSNALSPRLLSDNSFHFSQVADILDFLYENQLLPFIELGKNSYDYFKAEKSSLLFHGYSTDQRFYTMLTEFLNFIKGRYPSSWYNKWYFELWKAPAESIDGYLEGFKSIQHIIKAAIPSARFGGPGHSATQHPETFIRFLKTFSNAGIVPDFISAHFFSVQHYSEKKIKKIFFSPHTNFLSNQQKWMIKQIKEYIHPECPLYITEFNSSILTNTHINHSSFQAAYICHNLLCMHENSEFIGYWMLSDHAFSITSSSQYLNGGVSLITKSGLKLPSYHAYRLLNKMGSELIEKGENFCVTRNGEGHIQILTYNYAHFSSYATLHDPTSQNLKDTYKLFEEIPPVNISFHLTEITPGIYRIRRYLLDRQHGSFLDIQQGGLLGSKISEKEYFQRIHSPSPDVLQYLMKTCIPEERTIYLDLENELSVSTMIHPHGVCLWDIVKEL